ncbi:HD domain-containing phosphohydrolase [Oxalicibacterium faecigallinarum]|uniref:Metal-dependent phosphohydrolase n=1 Tax=Oxalicibacterium faecigallinarum TaxID=573741 RepID=A0A8J3F054_9BURK|nr:HD domain-containing phosphohydrolase [Oxalicibacterium faecigallinarum]GGI15982.1 metal-dependent phosphohydrolase [Oxalicibacterium faecigallinarum]
MKFRLPLHVHLSLLFAVALLLIGGLITAVGYYMSHDMLESSAEELTSRAGREIAGEIRSIIRPANMATDMLAQHRVTDADTFSKRVAGLRAMQIALRDDGGLTSIYIGYETGDYFFLYELRDDEERVRYGAPVGSRYQLRSIERSVARQEARYLYLDEDLQVLSSEAHPEYLAAFDPRHRGWYQFAQQADTTVTLSPYLFFSTGEVGLTIARRAANDHAVIGADIPLSSLSTALKKQKVTPSSQLVLVTSEGSVVAYEDIKRLIPASDDTSSTMLKHLDTFGIKPLQGMMDLIKPEESAMGMERSISVDDEKWRISVQPIRLPGAHPLYLMVAIPESELFATALNIRSASIGLSLLLLAIAIPLIWLISRLMSRSIRALAHETEAIRRFEFAEPIGIKSAISEVDALAKAMDGMKTTISKFTDVTQTVAAEKNFDKLLAKLLKETMSISGARSGALYLLDEEHMVACTAFGTNGLPQHESLRELTMSELPAVVRTAFDRGCTERGRLTPGEMRLMGLAPLAWNEDDGARVVVVPLFNRQRVLLGFMLLMQDEQIDDAQLAFVSALSASASSSVETRGLIRDQKRLFEAFIALIAGAIDAKSPYTGGHCGRVPELTKMLVKAACEQTSGPYADFNLNEDEWEAVHVAAWLHDCGKVTTPEYVVDKATKLETIYDRIHEVRMRFEVLKRDAEIKCLKNMAAGMEYNIAQAKLKEELQQLDEEFDFVASCNEGGEFMAPDKIERLKKIASRTWLRTLDDSLGISQDERRRKGVELRKRLPAQEMLLSDKAEHLLKRDPQHWMAPGNRWGFAMDVPEHLYNRGELHNLSVARGTLSAEERYKINEHMVQTIMMLSQLPFPRHLQQVPEIAGGHHERMDGTGYPRRLKQEDMSPMARMMAIADIFEALTAVDRPYKKGKSLSEAIRIMSFMKKDRHIDPELFDLFLSSGVYMDYARRFLSRDQIDEVDIKAYLA